MITDINNDIGLKLFENIHDTLFFNSAGDIIAYRCLECRHIINVQSKSNKYCDPVCIDCENYS